MKTGRLVSSIETWMTTTQARVAGAAFVVLLAVSLLGRWQSLPHRSPRQIKDIIFHPISKAVSNAVFALGFAINIVFDFFDSIHGQDSKKLSQWKHNLESLHHFLKTSGLEHEWGTILRNRRLLANLLIMDEIQDRHHHNRSSVMLRTTTSSTIPLVSSTTTVPTKTLRAGQHYMRHATAAYGKEMMASAELEVFGRALHFPLERIEDIVARHVQAESPDDVWIVDLDSGESTEYLRHLVTVDHKYKRIILSIRGTYSVSSLLVDLAVVAEDFCGGKAHSGIAAMARAVWNRVGSKILDRFSGVSDEYGLLLTGHSLGAGVASLIAILLHHQRENGEEPVELRGRPVECYAFAPPPTFGPLQAVPNGARDNTTSFVHNMDVVPSLSVDGIRRLMRTLQAVDNGWFPIRCRMQCVLDFMVGKSRPPSAFAQNFQESSKSPLPALDGAPTLFIPSKWIVWLKDRDGGGERYQTECLDCDLYAQRVMDIHSRMFSDHLVSQYERAFSIALSPTSKVDPMESFWSEYDDEDD